MSDVIRSAVKYRDRLRAELAKVDEFVRMAEEFSKVPEDGGLPFSKAEASAKPAAAVAATASGSDQPPIELARRNGNGAAAS